MRKINEFVIKKKGLLRRVVKEGVPIFGTWEKLVDRMALDYFEMGGKACRTWAKPTMKDLEFIFGDGDKMGMYQRAEKLARTYMDRKEFEEVKRVMDRDLSSLKGARGFDYRKGIERLMKSWIGGWGSEAIYNAQMEIAGEVW